MNKVIDLLSFKKEKEEKYLNIDIKADIPLEKRLKLIQDSIKKVNNLILELEQTRNRGQDSNDHKSRNNS